MRMPTSKKQQQQQHNLQNNLLTTKKNAKKKRNSFIRYDKHYEMKTHVKQKVFLVDAMHSSIEHADRLSVFFLFTCRLKVATKKE